MKDRRFRKMTGAAFASALVAVLLMSSEERQWLIGCR